MEAVEFNSFNQTVEHGNLRWARFEIVDGEIDYQNSFQTGTPRDGGGRDYYGTPENDILIGTAESDWFYASYGNDIIDGGGDAELDRLDYRGAYDLYSGSIVADLQAGQIIKSNGDVDTVSNIRRLIGSTEDDVIYGSDRTDAWESFSGDRGNDYIDGQGGNDYIWYGRAPE